MIDDALFEQACQAFISANGGGERHRLQAALVVVEPRLKAVEAMRKALMLAAIRLEILTGRARACNELTGVHGLLDEAEMFCQEAKQAINAYDVAGDKR